MNILRASRFGLTRRYVLPTKSVSSIIPFRSFGDDIQPLRRVLVYTPEADGGPTILQPTDPRDWFSPQQRAQMLEARRAFEEGDEAVQDHPFIDDKGVLDGEKLLAHLIESGAATVVRQGTGGEVSEDIKGQRKFGLSKEMNNLAESFDIEALHGREIGQLHFWRLGDWPTYVTEELVNQGAFTISFHEKCFGDDDIPRPTGDQNEFEQRWIARVMLTIGDSRYPVEFADEAKHLIMAEWPDMAIKSVHIYDLPVDVYFEPGSDNDVDPVRVHIDKLWKYFDLEKRGDYFVLRNREGEWDAPDPEREFDEVVPVSEMHHHQTPRNEVLKLQYVNPEAESN